MAAAEPRLHRKSRFGSAHCGNGDVGSNMLACLKYSSSPGSNQYRVHLISLFSDNSRNDYTSKIIDIMISLFSKNKIRMIQES